MFEEKLLEPHFTSVLAPYMLDVVEQKRALGNKYNAGVEHSVHSMTFAMSNNCVYLPFRKNCCKSGRKRDLTKTKPRNVFGFRMCEFFVSICTAMAMMLHVHSTLRLM